MQLKGGIIIPHIKIRSTQKTEYLSQNNCGNVPSDNKNIAR